jgi:hypothetical protein
MKLFTGIAAVLILSASAYAASSIDGTYRGTATAANGKQVGLTLDISENPADSQLLGELAIYSGLTAVVVSLGSFSFDEQAGSLSGSGSTIIDGQTRYISLGCSGAGSNVLSCTTTGDDGAIGHVQLVR